MKKFIAPFQSVVIASLLEDHHPFSSYAPFIFYKERFYIYVSDIATHAKNIQRDSRISLFFIEDEKESSNIFARKRMSLQALAQEIERNSELFESVMQTFNEKFDASMVSMLKGMLDFRLYSCEVIAGEATFGFGEAYSIGGENMQQLIPRKSSADHHKKG